jgi:hypothetical protein
MVLVSCVDVVEGAVELWLLREVVSAPPMLLLEFKFVSIDDLLERVEPKSFVVVL